VNVAGTEKLASDAAKAGVKRFIYLSTIKVNGEATSGSAFTASDLPHPVGDYARSKLAAEQRLHQIAGETGMDVVVVRPPLVYGPGVKANFLRLMQWIDRGFPIPLGNAANCRSLVALDNLVDLLALCVTDRQADGKVLLVSDGEAVSTVELVRGIARHMGKRAWIVPLPTVCCGGWRRCWANRPPQNDCWIHFVWILVIPEVHWAGGRLLQWTRLCGKLSNGTRRGGGCDVFERIKR